MSNNDLYGGMKLTSEECNVSMGLLAGILNTRDGKALAEIYEKHVPKISYDVEKAVIDMRSSATNGQVTIL